MTTTETEMHFNDWMSALTLADVRHELFFGGAHYELMVAQEQRRRMWFGPGERPLVGLTASEVARLFLANTAKEWSQQLLADIRREEWQK